MKPSYLDITKINGPDQCLKWWLIHSYLYYELNSPLLRDAEWNTLGQWLRESWPYVTHRHKRLVDTTTTPGLIPEAGFGSTAFHIKDYPLIIKSMGATLLRWDTTCKQRKKLANKRLPE